MCAQATGETGGARGGATRAGGGGVLERVYARLSRVTMSGEFIAEVDGLRFLAIAPVVVFHVRNYLIANPVADYAAPPEADWAALVTYAGRYGVQLFFVISGFILALPFARHYIEGAPRVELRRYFLRRLTRLEPPYVLVMLGCFALLVLLKGGAAELWPHLAASLTYTHGVVYGRPNPINLVAWSLEVEVQFYLLMPLLAAVFAVRGKLARRALIVGAAAAAVAFQTAFITGEGRLSRTLPNYLQYFLAGFLAADLYLCGAFGRGRRGARWDLAAAAALAALVWVGGWPGLARAAFAPLALLLFCAAFRGRLSNRLFTLAPVTVVGGMCYTIYLIHFQLLSAFEKAAGRLALTDHYWVNLLAHAALFAPVLLVSSAAFFLLVEKPCMRRDWPRRLGRRARAVFARRPAAEPAYGRGLAD